MLYSSLEACLSAPLCSVQFLIPPYLMTPLTNYNSGSHLFYGWAPKTFHFLVLQNSFFLLLDLSLTCSLWPFSCYLQKLLLTFFNWLTAQNLLLCYIYYSKKWIFSTTEMPTPGQSGLETVVRSRSVQLTKLNTEMTSTFAQVTGEMGAFRASSASTSTALASLSSQVAALTDLVTSLLPARAPEPDPSPPAVPPTTPMELPLDPRWEPSLPPPKPYAGEFDHCRGFLGQCELCFCHQASRFRSDGARVTPMSSLTDRALDWAVAAVWRDPRMSSDLPHFLEEFRRVFDHPTSGADAAGRLYSIKQGGRSIADYALEFRTLAADSRWDDVALRSAYRWGLSEEIKDLLLRDRPTSLNDLASLAYQMDERLRERRLERAQRSISVVIP